VVEELRFKLLLPTGHRQKACGDLVRFGHSPGARLGSSEPCSPCCSTTTLLAIYIKSLLPTSVLNSIGSISGEIV